MSESSGASDLLVKIGVDSSEVTSSLGELFSQIGEWVSEINPVLGSVAVAIAAIGSAAIESADVFEGAFVGIENKTGETGDDLETLKGQFADVFTGVPDAAGDVASALVAVNQRMTDLDPEQVTATTTALANMTTAFGGDLTTNVNAAISAMNAFGTSADGTTGYLNTIAGAVIKYNVPQAALNEAMQQAAPFAQAFGLSVNQTANFIGAMYAQTGNASAGTMALRTEYQKLSAAGADLNGAFQSEITNLGNLGQGTDQANSAMQNFGARGAAALVSAINNGKLSVDDLNTSLADTPGAVNAVSNPTETLGQQMTVLKNNVEAALAQLGAPIIEALGSVVSSINAALKPGGDLNNLFISIKEIAGPLASAITGIIGPIAELAKTLGGAVWTVFLNGMKGLADAVQTLSALWTVYKAKLDSAADGTDIVSLANKDLQNDLLDQVDATGKATTATGANTTANATNAAGLDPLAAKKAADAALTEAQKEGQAALTASTQILATLQKDTVIPTITDVATAQLNYNAAVAVAKNNLLNIQQAQTDYNTAVTKYGAASSQATQALDDWNTAIGLGKQAAADEKTALDNLNKSKSDEKQMDSDLQGAETTLASARKALATPAVVDLQAAESQLQFDRIDLHTAMTQLQTDEAALATLRDSTGVKDANAIAAAEATVKQDRQDVSVATKQVNDDEQTLKATRTDLLNATKDYNDAEQAIDTAIKSMYLPDTASFTDAIGNLISARNNQKAALSQVQDAENALDLVELNSQSTTDDYTTAENNLKQAKDNLTNSTKNVTTAEQQATTQLGLSKDMVNALALATAGPATSLDGAVNQTNADFQALGIKSTTSLQNLSSAAQTVYQNLVTNGQASATQLQQALINSLQAQYNAAVATSGPTSLTYGLSTQLQQAQAQMAYYTGQMTSTWGTMYTNINTDINNFVGQAIDQLFTGNTSFSKLCDKFLEQMAGQIVTDLLSPWTKAIANWVATTISNTLAPLSGAISGIFSSGGTVQGIDPGGSPGLGSILNSGSGTGSGAGGAAGGIGAGLSGVTGIFSAIGSIGSMITGAIGDFEQATTNNTLWKILETTTATAIGMNSSAGVLAYFATWNPLFYKTEEHLQTIMDDIDKKIGPAIGAGNLTQILQSTQARTIDILNALRGGSELISTLKTLESKVPVVNVAVTLNSQAIAAAIVTTVTNQMNAQTGG